jgi:hypothetical protein
MVVEGEGAEVVALVEALLLLLPLLLLDEGVMDAVEVESEVVADAEEVDEVLLTLAETVVVAFALVGATVGATVVALALVGAAVTTLVELTLVATVVGAAVVAFALVGATVGAAVVLFTVVVDSTPVVFDTAAVPLDTLVAVAEAETAALVVVTSTLTFLNMFALYDPPQYAHSSPGQRTSHSFASANVGSAVVLPHQHSLPYCTDADV